MEQKAPQFYIRSVDAWNIMLEDIRHAKVSIEIEQYIFTYDTIGKQFVDALTEKARQGVKVRMLLDMVGSYAFYASSLSDSLKKDGIEVRFFNRIRPWRIANFTANLFRDHRKILIIDNEIAQVGGVGIQDSMKSWRDTHMRMTGPIVETVKASFESFWEGVRMGFYIKPLPISDVVRKYDFLTNGPSLRQRYIHQRLIFEIRNAKKFIYLMTPYFIPDVPLYRALRLAAKRGVDVNIIVPEVADHIFVSHARESYFTLALRAGIKIFVYMPTMMHGKVAVVDGHWATAGSFNLDNLSIYFNHEANIASHDPDFIKPLQEQFELDLPACRQILYEQWVRRPWRKKFVELLTWPFHGIM